MDLSQVVEAVHSALNAHNAALGSTLVPAGKSLLISLATAVLAWRMVRSMLTDEGPYGVVSELTDKTKGAGGFIFSLFRQFVFIK